MGVKNKDITNGTNHMNLFISNLGLSLCWLSRYMRKLNHSKLIPKIIFISRVKAVAKIIKSKKEYNLN